MVLLILEEWYLFFKKRVPARVNTYYRNSLVHHPKAQPSLILPCGLILQEIPEEFVKKIFWELTPKATLTSSNGSIWVVDVKRDSNGTYFTQGWLKFVDENSVQRNDFLVFRYDGDMQFMVMLFDKTACEKDKFVHKHCQGETEKLGQKPIHGRHDNFSAKPDKGYRRKHVKAEENSSDFEEMYQKKQNQGYYNQHQSGSVHGEKKLYNSSFLSSLLALLSSSFTPYTNLVAVG